MGLFDIIRRKSGPVRLELQPPARAERRGDPLENPAVSLSSPNIWAWLVGGNNPTVSGELINHFTAMQQTTVYACVNLLAESVASLPLRIYERAAKGRMEDVDHPLYWLLSVEPNPEMTAFTFLETLTGCLALTGNGYAEILENRMGDIGGLYPLHPLHTEPFRATSEITAWNGIPIPQGEIAYRTTQGMPNGNWRIISASRMIHPRLFSFDGLKGASPIEQARQGIGLARAAEKYGARFFGNDSRPAGIMLFKGGKLDEKIQLNVRDSWERAQGGENQGKTAFLSGDWDYKQIGISPEQAQFLVTRQFQRAEIAAMWRIPPHMVGDTTRLSNNNAEQQNLSFVTDTLRPFLCRIESEVVRKCIPRQGRNANRHYVEFDVSERLRGDFKSTMDGINVGRQSGVLTINDGREQLGMNPVGPEGDVCIVPVNYQNAERLLDTESIQDQPTGGGQQQDPDDPDAGGADDEAKRWISAWAPLFCDAFGRVCNRDKRDLTAVRTIFGPIVGTIASTYAKAAEMRMDLDAAIEVERVVQEQLGGLAKRAVAWKGDEAEVTAELQRVMRGLRINVFREAGALVALKGDVHA